MDINEIQSNPIWWYEEVQQTFSKPKNDNEFTKALTEYQQKISLKKEEILKETWEAKEEKDSPVKLTWTAISKVNLQKISHKEWKRIYDWAVRKTVYRISFHSDWADDILEKNLLANLDGMTDRNKIITFLRKYQIQE